MQVTQNADVLVTQNTESSSKHSWCTWQTAAMTLLCLGYFPILLLFAWYLWQTVGHRPEATFADAPGQEQPQHNTASSGEQQQRDEAPVRASTLDTIIKMLNLMTLVHKSA